MRHCDAVIVGAGCAGLSLAHHWLERGLGGRRLVLLEPRQTYTRDRTWCGWNLTPHPFSSHVSHRWSRWRVREGAREVLRSAPGLCYERLPADAFYTAALTQIARSRDVTLERGVRAGAVTRAGGRAVVETDRGAYSAPLVFDSRPPPRRIESRPGPDAALLQSFVGWELEVGEDRFEPEVATLMDFAEPSGDAVHFVYVLPLDRRRALVEATWFGSRPIGEAAARAALERYLRERLGLDAWRTAHEERGVLPMGAAKPGPAVEGHVPIGVAAGAMRASSGYAFHAIQRHSAALAEALSSGAPLPKVPRGPHLEALDRALLSYMCRHPERMPALFVRLFERADPRGLARFLDDLASPAECAPIMAAAAELGLAIEPFRAFKGRR